MQSNNAPQPPASALLSVGAQSKLNPDISHCQQELSLLGHDLRAALSDVLGGLALIDLTTLDHATLRHIARARASGEMLERLLDEGLSVLHAAEATATANLKPLSIPKLLHDLDLRWSGRANEKGLSFTVAKTSNVPTTLLVDSLALERMLSNLIGNAIKYTNTGSVTCVVSCGDATLQFTITDSGPGFSTTDLATFFQHGNHASDEGKPGSGLGLRIAKEMADRMQAQLTVQNHKTGATAQITLPLTVATPPKRKAQPNLGGHKILIADDSATHRMLLDRMLTQLGAQITSVADGPAALAALHCDAFDLAFIDIELPQLSGLDVIRQLRQIPGLNAQTPVVAVTAHALHDVCASIHSAGANVILPKLGLDADALGHAVATVMPRHYQPPQDLDTSRFRQLVAMAGPTTARELIARLQSDLADVSAGLHQGFINLDWSALRAQSHILIALAGVVGATGLQHQAQTLNTAAQTPDVIPSQDLQFNLMVRLGDLMRFIAHYPQP